MAPAIFDPTLRPIRNSVEGHRASHSVALAALSLLIIYAGMLTIGATHGGWLADAQGRPGLRDFSEFWAAGRVTAQGHAASAYDWPRLSRLLQAAGARDFKRVSFPFFYPPPFLLVLALIGALPFMAAALAWTGALYAAFVAALSRLCVGRGLVLFGAAAPAAFGCTMVGQNGLLSAALIAGALALLDRRPVLAGVLIGALIYKPQLGVLFPVALAASGRWRSAASAAVTVLVLTLASGLIFSWAAWLSFAQAVRQVGSTALGGAVDKLQSVYGLGLALGASSQGAWLAQTAASVFAVIFVAWLWRRPRPAGLQAAGLIACVLLATPYSFIYDAPVLVPAVVLLAADAGRRPLRLYEVLLLGFAYLAPFSFAVAIHPVLPLCCLAVCVVVGGRAAEPAWVALSRAEPPRTA